MTNTLEIYLGVRGLLLLMRPLQYRTRVVRYGGNKKNCNALDRY